MLKSLLNSKFFYERLLATTSCEENRADWYMKNSISFVEQTQRMVIYTLAFPKQETQNYESMCYRPKTEP